MQGNRGNTVHVWTVVTAEPRSSDPSITCISGAQYACRSTTKEATHICSFPVTRPHVYSQNAISCCHRRSPQSPQAACVYRPVCDQQQQRHPFIILRRPSPPTARSLHLCRDHHWPMPSSDVYHYRTCNFETAQLLRDRHASPTCRKVSH